MYIYQGEAPGFKPSSLISRNGPLLLPIVIIVYISLQLLVTYTTQCMDQNYFIPSTENYFLGAGFVFSISALQHLAKAIYCYNIESTSSHKKFMLHMAAVTISLIAGSSSFLTFVFNGGSCRTEIEGQASLWSQWIVCSPLLAYIAISGEEKHSLSYKDVGVIISTFVLVLCMLLIVFTFTTAEVDKILFVLCYISVIVSMLLALMKVNELSKYNPKQLLSKKCMSFFILAMSDSLFRFTWGILPLLPILSFINDFGIISRTQLQIGYVVLSLFANWIFLNSIVDEQIHIAEKIRFREEAEMLANATRQTFLRLVPK
jgi:hypothetical protein